VAEYDRIAEWYASERVDQTGVPEANALASSLPPGSLVLITTIVIYDNG
jgi:hypothetical protein